MTKTQQQPSNVIPFPTAKRKAQRRGDVFRTEAAQDMFRERWNAYQARQAKLGR